TQDQRIKSPMLYRLSYSLTKRRELISKRPDMVAALHATEFPNSVLQLFYTHTASRGALSIVVLQPLQRLLAYVFKHVGSCFGRFPVMSWYHCDRCGTPAQRAGRLGLKPRQD
ncbi:hypothetical protein, partial [Sphingorhabdus sp.]|uniref:hypothetical protein n=1 Tax=Sphingorhabdus sp. TaxID=1902408 RepID=UPI00333E4C3E